jgi:hypothetical protein
MLEKYFFSFHLVALMQIGLYYYLSMCIPVHIHAIAHCNLLCFLYKSFVCIHFHTQVFVASYILLLQ